MENAPPPRAPDSYDSRPPSSSKPPPQLAARAAREFKMLATDAPPGVAAWPVGDSLTSLRAQIRVRGALGWELVTLLVAVRARECVGV